MDFIIFFIVVDGKCGNAANYDHTLIMESDGMVDAIAWPAVLVGVLVQIHRNLSLLRLTHNSVINLI